MPVAQALLNKLLVTRSASGSLCVGRIVETEAYDGSDDPASHAYRGETPRNAMMFGPPGFLYVYFTYGMHYCANAVCGEEGQAAAVLIRALAPVAGVESMKERRRPGTPDRHLTSGPAKLCEAMGIGAAQKGTDLTSSRGIVFMSDDGVSPPVAPGIGPRVGIRRGADLPWRFWVPGDPNVSRFVAPAPKPVTGRPPGV